MSVDIRDLLEDAAADPVAPPDYDALWTRGRRQRRLTGAGAVAVVLTAVAVMGGLATAVTGDRAPGIMERPDDGRPAPGDVDLPATEHTIGAGDLASASERSAPEVIATFQVGEGPDQIGRGEKGTGPRSLSAFLPCASGGSCADGMYARFGLLDGARDRILIHGTGDGLRDLRLERWGFRSPGTLLLQRIRGWDVAFVTVARDASGAGVQRLLAIDLTSEELLAEVPFPGSVANPRLIYGSTPGSTDTATALWVEADDGWHAVLSETTDPETNRLAFDFVLEERISSRAPVDDRTYAAVEVHGSSVDVTWEPRDRSWHFDRGTVVRAAHPTVDGLLAVLQHEGAGASVLFRIVGGEVVSRTPLGPPDEWAEYVFQPDGTLLVLTAGVDGAAVVTAHRPTDYARASRFVGNVSGSLRIIDGEMWVIDECYVSPLSEGPPAVCAAREAVEGGAAALVEAHIDVDGRPREEGIRRLEDLPGATRPDLVGARWAEVGGELVHVGVRVGGRLFVYELDTGALRPAVPGEFDTATDDDPSG